jgi:glycine hydroxymethyltransferase
MIFFRKGLRSTDKKGVETHYDLEERINASVFPGHQGGPHNHTITALAVALKMAQTPEYKQYQTDVMANSQAMAQALIGHGYDLVSGGTDNHMMVVDLTPFDAELTGKVAQATLDEAGITLNKNTIPDDPRSPFVTSGVRIGTPSVTTQGMQEPEMAEIAKFIARALRNVDNAEALAVLKAEVAVLCARFPAY